MDLHQGATAAVEEARRLEASSQGEEEDVENIFFSSTVAADGFGMEDQDIGFPSFIGEAGMMGGFEVDEPLWDSFATGIEGNDGFGAGAFHTA